jgi:hypothetical protein
VKEETRWKFCCSWLAQSCFTEGRKPDPEELGQLLEELGVSLETMERYVDGDEGDGA